MSGVLKRYQLHYVQFRDCRGCCGKDITNIKRTNFSNRKFWNRGSTYIVILAQANILENCRNPPIGQELLFPPNILLANIFLIP